MYASTYSDVPWPLLRIEHLPAHEASVLITRTFQKISYLVRIRNKRNTPRRQNTHPLYLAPFLKMSRNNLLDIVTDMDTTDVKRPILSQKRSDTTHIIPVIAEFVATETVDVGVEDVVYCG